MMDAIEKYEPDFIYTDGTDQQPFSGSGTGTGYKCDAMQRVMADFYNRTLARKGEVDAFSIVKFRDATNGTVNTCETAIPADIKTDQAWIAETPIGDWFYAPDFVYSPDAVIRYMLEIVSRDGVFGLCIPIAPDGSLDEACVKMLADVGEWMRVNGDGIYGSAAWKVLGEGEGETQRPARRTDWGASGQPSFPHLGLPLHDGTRRSALCLVHGRARGGRTPQDRLSG